MFEFRDIVKRTASIRHCLSLTLTTYIRHSLSLVRTTHIHHKLSLIIILHKSIRDVTARARQKAHATLPAHLLLTRSVLVLEIIPKEIGQREYGTFFRRKRW